MNERIKELAEQAGFIPDAFLNKFAELIIRECGAVAYKAYWANPETVRGRHIEEKIREHFGVEQ